MKKKAGGERCVVQRFQVEFNVSDPDVMRVEYKVGRKTRCESYPRMVLAKVKQKLLSKTIKPSALYLATHKPALFWHVHYYCVDCDYNTVALALEKLYDDVAAAAPASAPPLMAAEPVAKRPRIAIRKR